MRIGIFTDTYLPFINGVSTSVDMLKKALEKKGHQVFIVTVNPTNMGYIYENKVLRIPGIPIGIFDYRITSIYSARALKIIRKWNLDIIHSQTEFGIGTYARILAKQYSIPIVHTYHTYYEDYMVYINKGHFDKLTKAVLKQATNFLCDKTINELIVPTEKIHDLFKEKYKVDRNVYVIPTGINTKQFYRSNFKKNEILDLRMGIGLKEDDISLLWVGRLGPEKNIDFLIKNHNEIVKKYPNCKLVIIGDGPERKKLEKMSKKNVIFVGKVPFEKMSLYYQLGDILVTASKSETQGLTVNEAMSASLPVLAIDDDAFKNSVIDGVNGYIFKNKKDYIQKISKLIDNNELDNLRKGALKTSDNFSSKIFAERVLNVYNIALDKKPTSFIDKVKSIFGGKK